MDQQKHEDSISFAVDLTKEEYLKFYKVLSRYSNVRMMNIITIVIAVLALATHVMPTVLDHGVTALVSLDTVYAVVPPVLLLLYQFVLMPIVRKKQALRSYEAALASGHVFAGTVTVSRRGITKMTVCNSCTLSFDNNILFHQQEDMQIFVNPQGTSIILPARCMTKEQAATVREIVTGVLPVSLVRVAAPIICERTEPMELPQVKPMEPLFTASVSYNEEDMRLITKETTLRALKNSILPGTVMGFLLAILFYSGDFLISAAVFWVVLAITLLGAFLTARRRAKLLLQDENFRFTFKVTELAVITDGGERRGVVTMPFKMMKHAVESEKHVEFYNREQYMCIPKRFIADMDSFRSMIDRCRKDV